MHIQARELWRCFLWEMCDKVIQHVKGCRNIRMDIPAAFLYNIYIGKKQLQQYSILITDRRNYADRKFYIGTDTAEAAFPPISGACPAGI